MKFAEIKGLDRNELISKLKELKMDLLMENAQIANKTTPKNPGKVRDTKKTIARIMSVLGREEKSRS